MKAYIYARVSPTRRIEDEKTGLAYSIAQQLEKCRKQAEVDNVEIVKEFYDEYVSGKAQEYMKSFQQMLNLILKEKNPDNIDKIYVLRVDRFGRNMREMLNAEKELRDRNVFIKFVEQGFDTSNNFGRMIMGILASIAEWQREEIITKTRIGREIAFKNNPEKFGRPRIKINWSEVKKMLEMKTQNGEYVYSWSKIARLMNVSPSTLIRRYKEEVGELPVRRR